MFLLLRNESLKFLVFTTWRPMHCAVDVSGSWSSSQQTPRGYLHKLNAAGLLGISPSRGTQCSFDIFAWAYDFSVTRGRCGKGRGCPGVHCGFCLLGTQQPPPPEPRPWGSDTPVQATRAAAACPWVHRLAHQGNQHWLPWGTSSCSTPPDARLEPPCPEQRPCGDRHGTRAHGTDPRGPGLTGQTRAQGSRDRSTGPRGHRTDPPGPGVMGQTRQAQGSQERTCWAQGSPARASNPPGKHRVVPLFLGLPQQPIWR